MTARRVAIAWLRQEDWPTWLSLDARFQPDYQHWLGRIEKMEAALKANGLHPVRITVDVATFAAWARAENGGDFSTGSRSQYAALALMHGDEVR